MKRSSKLIAMLLVVAMAASLLCIPGFADEASYPPISADKGGFLMLGDSVARGMGATPTYWEDDEYNNYECRNVTNAFPCLVADALGCVMPWKLTSEGNYWPCCQPGLTLAATYDLMGIDDGYYDAEYAHNYNIWQRYDDALVPYFGCKNSVLDDGTTYGETGSVGDVNDLVEKASVIAVELGMCDVIYRPYCMVTQGGLTLDISSLDLGDQALDMVKTLVVEMYKGYDYWLEYYPKFIKMLRDKNPSAEIVMVGSFNMLEGVTITNDLIIPVGNAFSIISAGMNEHYKQWAKEFGIKYVDISNVECGAKQWEWSLLGDFMSDANKATHPTPEGHRYIARQILAALDGASAAHKNAISVDLGRFEKVSYVTVDGNRVKNFSMDGFVLTVPYKSTGAKTMTVAVEQDDGTTAFIVYHLSYDHGYTANRLYGTNNLFGTMFKPIKLMFSGLQTIINFFKGLFA